MTGPRRYLLRRVEDVAGVPRITAGGDGAAATALVRMHG